MRSTLQAADEAYARYCAARADLLERVSELAASGEWQGFGAGNLPSFLAGRWQILGVTTRDLVRDSEALEARPALRDALTSGSISVDQCKALSILSAEGTDDDQVWLEALPFWSMPELEREARKKVARDLEKRDNGTYLRTRHTPDERYLRGEFQLHPEDGATLIQAIDSLIPNGTPLRDWDQAGATALVELAKGSSGNADRPTLLVSVSEAVLAGGDDVAALAAGGFVGAETARRLACDARFQVLLRDEDGKITGFGRTSRNISPAMRRVVEERDRRMCAFPGCERDTYLECHHIIPVAEGGPTVLDNLLLVCWKHHELVHEGGWSLRGEAGPRITWVCPDGRPFEPRVRVVRDTS